jgi:hypothetical protein
MQLMGMRLRISASSLVYSKVTGDARYIWAKTLTNFTYSKRENVGCTYIAFDLPHFFPDKFPWVDARNAKSFNLS